MANENGLIELDHGKIVRIIKSDKIQQITLCYGCAAARPALEALIGGLFCAAGLWAGVRLVEAMVIHRLTAAGFVMAILGVAMLRDVVKKSHYLLVETQDDTFKLKFSSKAEPSEIQTFCRALTERFGYAVSGVELAEMPLR